MMNEVVSPTITINNDNFFSDKEKNTTSYLKIDKNTIHPGQPLLLTPNSILRRNELFHTNTPPVLISVYSDRRPSLVKFSCDSKPIIGSTDDIFYDAHSNISTSPTSERKPSSKNSFSIKKRRPSYLSNVSSVKTTSISIHSNPDQPSLKQGILLCCTIKKKTNRHYPMKWNEFYAVISPSNSLQLYPTCDCNDNRFTHMLFHQHNSYYKRPKYHIQLDQSFHLSLASPIDFVWSLESDTYLFYFQTGSIANSQSWYRTMYAALPVSSKKPLPHSVDVHLPQLNLSIRLPLNELIQGDETVDLRRVRDCAVTLLHRHGNIHWNKRSVGLCWKYHNTVDWVVHPEITQPANLIEPRLIEQLHELEMWCEPSGVLEKEPPILSGYLTTSGHQPSCVYFARVIDHYLFLYSVNEPSRDGCWLDCFEGVLRRYQTVPQDEHGSVHDLVQVIDLLHVKKLTRTAIDLDDTTQLTNVDPDFTSHVFQHVQHYKDNKVIKEIGVVYIKSKLHRFEKRLCILVTTGEFYILTQQRHAHPSYSVDFCVSLVDSPSLYMLSGDDLCHHIPGLPTKQLPSMIFENGLITQDTKPNQCCFIMYYQHTPIVFLTRSKQDKENWLHSICSFLS